MTSPSRRKQPLGGPSVALLFLAAGAGVFIAALDQTVVVTALPQIFNDLGVPVTRLDQGAWIVTGYLVGFTAAMPLMGQVSDAYGHARVYALALFVFLLGSALVALGNSLGWIVGARVLQAAGGGALVPVTIALVGEAMPARRRGVAIGVVAAVAEAGAVLGPLYGGLVLMSLEWRWLFWLNLPLAGLVMAVIGPHARRANRRPGAVDYGGGVLLGAALACLALGLAGGSALPGGVALRGGLLAGAVLLLGLFLYAQARPGHRLFPIALFRRARLMAANGANLLVGGGLILALVNVPLMTDTVMGGSALEGGLRLLRLTAMIPVGAVLGGYLCQRAGYRLPMFLGLALAALGFLFLSRWPIDIGDPRMTLELMVGGLGFGLVIAPITLAVLNSVREEQKATASALVTVMRMTGMIIGLAALSSWGKERFTELAGRIPSPVFEPGATQAVIDERTAAYQAQVSVAALSFFHEVFVAAMIVVLVGLLPAFIMGMRGRDAQAGRDIGPSP